MKLQEAIAIALDFEKKVRDHYLRGAKDIADPMGQRVFAVLGKEEQGHVDYLEHCLAQWKKSGKVANVPLKSDPAAGHEVDRGGAEEARRAQGQAGRDEDRARGAPAPRCSSRRRRAPSTTSSSPSCPARTRPLFDKFLGIEDGHLALVQAQLDSVQGIGFWFDVAEFRLEAE